MSIKVDEINNVVLLFSNSQWPGTGVDPGTIIRNITALGLGYSLRLTENITILASSYLSTTNGVIQGLLYVPDIDLADPCQTVLQDYLPARVVRQADLPPSNYNLIAFAPWIDVNCTKSFLASARSDSLRAFIFYKPSNLTPKPLPANSPSWNLNDDGRWKSQNHFPIMAISGLMGQHLMQQLSLYSGNATQVPYGNNISDLYSTDANDYIRIWTQMTVSEPLDLLNIGLLFLGVFGVLLSVIVSTSLLMHLVQSRRRALLRRAVRRGEINLEGMGIKRLTVPRKELEKFPLYTYDYSPDSDTVPTSPTPPQLARTRLSRGRSGSAASPLPISEQGLDSPFASSTIATGHQPSCVICLEVFQNQLTVIRELPCGHIFHPQCIDEFLSERSSLCPLCKACLLPKGYCPRITNSMVRREYAIRRLRDKVEMESLADGCSHRRKCSWRSSLRMRVFHFEHSERPATSVHLQPREPSPSPGHDDGNPLEQQQRDTTVGGNNQSVVAQRRMRELAGSDVDDDEDSRRLSRAQLIRRRLFPGFW